MTYTPISAYRYTWVYVLYIILLKKDVMENCENKIKNAENSNKKEIIKTWLAGQHSCTLIIPKEFAKEYGLDTPSHVIVEGTPQGILIKRLEV